MRLKCKLNKDYLARIKYCAGDVENEECRVLNMTAPVWGRTEIDGTIICTLYNITLHVIEESDSNLITEGVLHQIISETGSKSDDPDWKDNNQIHICNNGHEHFVPVLRERIDMVHSTSSQEPSFQESTSNKMAIENVPELHEKEGIPDSSFYLKEEHEGEDYYLVGKADYRGMCFFDSFAQCLSRQKGVQYNWEQFRQDCADYAEQNRNDDEFLEILDIYRDCNTIDEYISKIRTDDYYGDAEVEGMILCEKYEVRLHIRGRKDGKCDLNYILVHRIRIQMRR